MDTQASDKIKLVDLNSNGKTVADGVERTLSREAYAMLAQANLLRMRGAWSEAIERCMAALRLSPDNPSAQSLLGDIYENQGRIDDAIQWYRMALDVQPDSPADRLKLSRLLDLKACDLTAPVPAKPDEPTPISPVTPPTPLRTTRFTRWRSSPDEILRRFASIAGALAVVVIIAALILAHQSLTNSGIAKQVDAPPVVLPSVMSVPAPGPSPDAPASVVADPSELAILSSLRITTAVANVGYSVTSVQIDPRAARLTVSITCPPAAAVAPGREAILRGTTGVLQAALPPTDGQVITQFTVRCLLLSSTGASTPLVFTADATRASIAALNPNLSHLTADQIASAYTNPWWAPSVTR